MDAIDLMREEHNNIKRMLSVIRRLCVKIVEGEQMDYYLFYKVIDFVRNYADKHHHLKEENIIFKEMSDKLGESIARGPVYGMLAEHDLGRLFIYNLENAVGEVRKGSKEARVDVIGNAIAYADLLNRHIEKEDSTIYEYARRRLSEESITSVNLRCGDAENLANQYKTQAKYLKLLEELEEQVFEPAVSMWVEGEL